MKCSKKSCDNIAVVNVGINANSTSLLGNGAQGTIQWFFDICLCARCRDTIVVDHILTPEGNRKMNAALEAQGKCHIDFKTAQLMFRHVDDMPGSVVINLPQTVH